MPFPTTGASTLRGPAVRHNAGGCAARAPGVTMEGREDSERAACFHQNGPAIRPRSSCSPPRRRPFALNVPGNDADFGGNETGIVKHVTLPGVARVSGDHHDGAINEL